MAAKAASIVGMWQRVADTSAVPELDGQAGEWAFDPDGGYVRIPTA